MDKKAIVESAANAYIEGYFELAPNYKTTFNKNDMKEFVSSILKECVWTELEDNLQLDDLNVLPHIVVAEKNGHIELFEFKRGDMVEAHNFAMDRMIKTKGRILVAARVRHLDHH